MSQMIKPTKAVGGLFSVGTKVEAGPDAWATGWKFPDACPSGGLWECADSDADTNKEEPTAVTIAVFTPFQVYQVAGCLNGTSRIQPKEYRDIAKMWLDLNLEGWASIALETGVGGPALSALPDVTVGAPSLSLAMSILMQNRLQDGVFDKPTIHLPSWTAPYFDSGAAIAEVANIVFGPYNFATPGAAGTAYITGNVEYAIGNGTLEELTKDDASTRRQNRAHSLEEQMVLLRYSTCGAYAIDFSLAV